MRPSAQLQLVGRRSGPEGITFDIFAFNKEKAMPTYDYECTKCGHTFDEFQSMSDEPLKSCPECGKGVRRLIGGGMGIIFKGSGFYVTDSRSSPAGASAGKKKEEGASSSSSEAPSTSSGSDGGDKSGSSSKEKVSK